MNSTLEINIIITYCTNTGSRNSAQIVQNMQLNYLHKCCEVIILWKWIEVELQVIPQIIEVIGNDRPKQYLNLYIINDVRM